MGKGARGAIKGIAFLLPLALLAAAVGGFGSDLRRLLERRKLAVEVGSHLYIVPNGDWKEHLSLWTEDVLAHLSRADSSSDRARPRFGFRPFTRKLTLLVVDPAEFDELPSEGSLYPKHAHSAYDPSNDRITLRRVPEPRLLRRSLAMELALAMLHHAAEDPQVGWSPWLCEGIARYFEVDPLGTEGRRREDLLRRAQDDCGAGDLARLRRAPARAFSEPGDAQASARAYALLHFLVHTPDYGAHFEEYVREERKPGPVDPAAFGRIFGPAVEEDWLAFLNR